MRPDQERLELLYLPSVYGRYRCRRTADAVLLLSFFSSPRHARIREKTQRRSQQTSTDTTPVQSPPVAGRVALNSHAKFYSSSSQAASFPLNAARSSTSARRALRGVRDTPGRTGEKAQILSNRAPAFVGADARKLGPLNFQILKRVHHSCSKQ